MGVLQDMKEVAELAKKLGNIDLYTKILELRIEMNDISQEKLSLQQKVNELEERMRLKERMSFSPPFWYLEGDDTPYCPSCFENMDRAIHMVALDRDPNGRWQCSACKFLCWGSAKSNVSPHRTGAAVSPWG